MFNETIPEEKTIEVTYKFQLPDHELQLKLMQNASEYYSTLDEIYQECRRIWKYEENASEELVKFAEKIGQMAYVDMV